MNTSHHVVGFTSSAAKRSIASMLSLGNLAGVSLFLEHRAPGIQRRAQSALATPTPTGAIMPQTAEERTISAQDFAAHKAAEVFCREERPAGFYELYGTSGCSDVASTLAKLAQEKSPEPEVKPEASSPDFAALAVEYGEPDASALPALYIAKGSDEGALRRSLSARRASRASKAKRAAQADPMAN